MEGVTVEYHGYIADIVQEGTRFVVYVTPPGSNRKEIWGEAPSIWDAKFGFRHAVEDEIKVKR